jgi:hypothetical protein
VSDSAVWREAYAAGYEAGGKAALRSASHLTTMLNDRRTLEALRRLMRFMEWPVDEDERGSEYWHDELVDEAVP